MRGDSLRALSGLSSAELNARALWRSAFKKGLATFACDRFRGLALLIEVAFLVARHENNTRAPHTAAMRAVSFESRFTWAWLIQSGTGFVGRHSSYKVLGVLSAALNSVRTRLAAPRAR